MSKVPCGGFELDESLALNNGKLGLAPGAGGGLPSSGTPYQQLVTDGNGNTKWEDRLAYDNSRLVVDLAGGMRTVKVADEVPSWMSVDAPTKIWTSDGTNLTATIENNVGYDNGSFRIYTTVFVITEDNSIIRIHEDDERGYEFPEKGVYFTVLSNGKYVSGISSADSDTPELTWDGNVSEIKKLDEKFLPDMLILYMHNSAGGVV